MLRSHSQTQAQSHKNEQDQNQVGPLNQHATGWLIYLDASGINHHPVADQCHNLLQINCARQVAANPDRYSFLSLCSYKSKDGRQPSHQTKLHLARPTTIIVTTPQTPQENNKRQQRRSTTLLPHGANVLGRALECRCRRREDGLMSELLGERGGREEPLMANRQRCRRHKARDLSLSLYSGCSQSQLIIDFSGKESRGFPFLTGITLLQVTWMWWGIASDQCFNVLFLLLTLS
jgi:hypothetical protein